MWHKPRLLLATADLLLIAGVVLLCLALAKWVVRLPLMPIQHVVVTHELREVSRAELEQVLAGVQGNLYSVSLEGVRHALEKLAWVRRAEVRRKWPNTLVLTLQEQKAVARWGDGSQQLVNSYGEVFYGNSIPVSSSLDNLPSLMGPLGSAPDLLAQLAEIQTALASTGRTPVQLTLNSRLAWQLRLDDGMLIELGREQQRAQIVQRLQRFASVYAQSVASSQQKAQVVDLRYPNGFVLRAVANGV